MTGPEGAEVLESHTVVFMPTSGAPYAHNSAEEVVVPHGSAGPLWDWVVVGVVKGTGRGVVGRADRAVRKWVSVSR